MNIEYVIYIEHIFFAVQYPWLTKPRGKLIVLFSVDMFHSVADMIFVKKIYTSTFSKFTPRKRVNRDILNLKHCNFGIFIHLIVIVSQFSYIYAHFTHYQWVKHIAKN